MDRQELKNQIIKNAYLEHWDKVKDFVDSSGYICYGDIKNETISIKDSEIEFTELSEDIDLEYWIPKTLKKELQKIDNQWIKQNITQLYFTTSIIGVNL